MMENRMKNTFYIISDSREKIKKDIKSKIKKITGLTVEHKPIFVGATSKTDDIMAHSVATNRRNPEYAKVFEAMMADNAGKEMVVMVRNDAVLLANKVYEVVGTVANGNGTLLNQAAVHRTPADTPNSSKLFKTPQGNYKSGQKAADALGVIRQVLGRWCNHNHKLIPESTRKAYPDLFNGYLTFQDAGFGRC